MIKCFGNFKVNAFPLTDKKWNWCHSNGDGSECECYGFLIHHPDITNFLYATDCSFVRWNFIKHNLHHILIECNYMDEIIDLEINNKQHVISGHMEFETTKKFIEANMTLLLETVTLCHLSNSNSDSNYFKNEIQKLGSFNVDIADKGKVINLKTLPF